ncbi:MAG: hypothetical protein Q9219_002393 [cf. Caloplaca sp. 3 TL-2023]
MTRMPYLTALASFLLTITSVAALGASTFVTDDSNNNLTFSINVPDSKSYPNDFGFYLSAPHANSWIGVGFGKGMRDAFMLIVYTDKGGKNLTVSPRVGTTHAEPSYYDNKTMSIEIKDAAIRNKRYVVSAICHNCREWDSGAIDFNSTTQPMIYAVGSDELNLNSNAKNAGLRRHDFWGKYNIDLVAARGDINLFPPKDLSSANVTDHEEHDDHEYSSSVHAVFMIGTFVIMLPIGIFYKKVLGNVRWHYYTQALGVIIVLIGAGLGIGLSHFYNRSKHYNSVHQLIGMVIVLLLLIQAGLGAAHHRIFKAKQQHTIMGTIHRFLGLAVVGAAVVNGAL